MRNANIRFDVISNFRFGDFESGRYGVAEVAYGRTSSLSNTANHPPQAIFLSVCWSPVSATALLFIADVTF